MRREEIIAIESKIKHNGNTQPSSFAVGYLRGLTSKYGMPPKHNLNILDSDGVKYFEYDCILIICGYFENEQRLFVQAPVEHTIWNDIQKHECLAIDFGADLSDVNFNVKHFGVTGQVLVPMK